MGRAVPIKQPATRPITSGALSENSGATRERTSPARKPIRPPISVMMVKVFVEASNFMANNVASLRMSAMASGVVGLLLAHP